MWLLLSHWRAEEPHIDVQMSFQGDLMFLSSARGDCNIDQLMVSACFTESWGCLE